MQKNIFLLLKNWKNTSSAQLCLCDQDAAKESYVEFSKKMAAKHGLKWWSSFGWNLIWKE